MTKYETVIGLEVHVELSTKSKIFCGCAVKFKEPPNTLCCPVCTGMPGVLPVLNKKVLEYAVKTGLATGCGITEYFKFDRKNYFYPDLPKAYQISQLYLPICKNGELEINLPNGTKKTVRIHEIHMEEDAGKLIHDPWEDKTLVDYNRCGVPLLEIVSEPDMRSSEEAIAYITKLKSVLEYLDVSDCKMQEGSMRADINLSVRPYGQTELGTRTEMKNMNSLKAIARAIDEEAKRQIEVIESGKKIIQQTRRWDENKDSSFAMRSKENAQDYRYFPEPDLLPFEISKDWIADLKGGLPELIDEKKARYKKDYNLPDLDIDILTSSIKTAILFENAIIEGCDPKEASNWIKGDILKALKDVDKEVYDLDIKPHAFARTLTLLAEGKINRNAAKQIMNELVVNHIDPDAYIKEHSLEQICDEAGIGECIREIIASNQSAIADYKSGKDKAFSFLVGQIMRQMKGKASPGVVNEKLKEELDKI